MSQRTADRRIGHTVRERPSRPFVDVNTKSTAKPLPKPSNPPTFRRSKTEPIQPVAVQGSSTNRKLLHPHWTPSDRDKNSTPPSPPDSRWSEVIPPHTALTFAAIWDPVEGMVAFSGAQLRDFLDKDVSFNTRPTSPGDGDSQILTIDRFALPSTVNSAALALDMERMPMTFACEAVMEPDTYADIFLRPGWQTPTPLPEPEQSSPKPPRSRSAVFASLLRQLPPDTMGELHWSKTEKDSLDSPRYDFVKGMMGSISSKGSSKQSGRVFGPVYEKSVTDEGFFEGRDNRISMGSGEAVMVEVNLNSSFSMTTTSTSKYIEVNYDPFDDSDSSSSSSWSTLRAPDDSEYLSSSNNSPTSQNRRRLMKRRFVQTSDTPARASRVLAREEYNFVSPSPTDVKPTLQRVKECLRHKCSKREDERWVTVEVTQLITQHIKNVI